MEDLKKEEDKGLLEDLKKKTKDYWKKIKRINGRS
jgi:hypothetical protein